MNKFLTINNNDDIIIEVVNLEKATRGEAEEFKIILLKHIDNGDVKLVVDLHQCDFLDSTFLSTLLIALKLSMSKGGKLILVSPKQDVAAVLEATGMNRVFDIYKSIPEALDSFNTQ